MVWIWFLGFVVLFRVMIGERLGEGVVWLYFECCFEGEFLFRSFSGFE